MPNIETKKELIDVAKLLYKVNKHSLALHDTASPETQKIVNKNMRMGIGVTGYLQATDKQRGWLSDCYEELRKFDVEYSEKNGFPTSIKLTTCKPSGTLSLLPGVTPGVHPGYAQHMIRRISIASDHPLVDVCREHGYPIEYRRNFDKTDDHSTVIVEFPFAFPEGTVLAKDVSALDQLEWVKKLQTEWSDNSVSCTVYYRAGELDEIKSYLKKHYNKGFKSLSFLLHNEHGFDQAPLEEITEQEYNKRIKKVKLITQFAGDLELDEDAECAGGMCPVR